MTASDALKFIHECGDQVVLNVLKYCPSPHPSLVSSSASSGHNLTETSPDTGTGMSPRSQVGKRWDLEFKVTCSLRL